MVESGKASHEFKDPILYSFHPDVRAYQASRETTGRYHDHQNNSSIYYSLPSWIIEDDETKKTTPHLKNLTQIVGSYFDTLSNNISSIPQLKQPQYLSSSHKPYPFANRLLESVGFSYVPELFADASFLEQYRDRDDKIVYKQKLYDIKNTIYQNIYNNITYIYKAKGTEKSFRNFIRCFGVDDELYKLNVYAQNGIYELKDNIRSVGETKKYANFATTGSNVAVVYQHSSSTNSNSTSFLSGTNFIDGTFEGAGMAFTMEADVVFPFRFSQAESNTVHSGSTNVIAAYNPFISASLFGLHQVSGAVENELTWHDPDNANFQVYAVRDTSYSKRCFFQLTGTAGSVIPTLESEYFDDVFTDERWNFSVAVKPIKYPFAGEATGSNDSKYIIEFYGVQNILNQPQREFIATEIISNGLGRKFMSANKSIYMGAHRTNFTGSLLERSDANVSSARVWATYIDSGTVKQHATDVKSYGVPSPYRSAYLYQSSMTGTYVPQIQTLALNWTLDTVTGSDASGQYFVEDFSSGSSDVVSRYNWLGDIIGKQHLGKGDFFPANYSGSVDKKYLYSGKRQLPETISSADMVNILDSEDVTFTRDSRPVNYYLLFEKSMYQTISEEIVRMFSSIKDFNNLIGDPVNLYRPNYKRMEKLRQLFFERVNNIPELDKYVEYYKWLDSALNIMLADLIPASANVDTDESIIKNMVESHVLERNKYRHKYPTFEDRTPDPEGKILGIGELLYNWKYGHAPLSDANKKYHTSEDTNCLWWKERAERRHIDRPYGGGLDLEALDTAKQVILEVMTTKVSGSAPTFAQSSSADGISIYQGSTFAIRNFVTPTRLKINEVKGLHGGVNFSRNKKLDYFTPISRQFNSTFHGYQIVKSSLGSASCQDDSALDFKPKLSFTVPDGEHGITTDFVGELIAPFNLVSSSANTVFQAPKKDSATQIVNIHHDTYGYDKETPLQSPFTEKFVGGKPYRHTWNNFDLNSNNEEDRAEGWRIQTAASRLRLMEPSYTPGANFDADLARSVFYRDETAKRPVNIRNIQQATGSELHGDHTVLGNYTKNYEIVMTNGRSINNVAFVHSGGFSSPTTAESTAVSGIIDFKLPTFGTSSHVIVNRFSAPGGFEVMSEGYLDFSSREYSVYNAMPWRNQTVRTTLNTLHTNHCKQFGYYSDTQNSAAYGLADAAYPGTSGSVNKSHYYAFGTYNAATASYHKVNRNSVSRIRVDVERKDSSDYLTGTQHDNWFVRHQIPQTDLQYAWITASIISGYSGSGRFGFEKPDWKNASLASTDLTFCSASDFVSFRDTDLANGYRFFGVDKTYNGRSDVDDFIFTDFVGMNHHVYEPVTSSTNTLGYPRMTSKKDSSNPLYQVNYINTTFIDGPDDGYGVEDEDRGRLLNAILLNRQGPYGGANWKLYRKESHPVVRTHRKENKISWIQNSLDFSLGNPRSTPTAVGISPKVASQVEPPITSKYRPIKHDVTVKVAGYEGIQKDSPTTETFIMHSHGNKLAHFTEFPMDLPGVASFYNLNHKFKFLKNTQPPTMYDTLTYLIKSGEVTEEVNPIKGIRSVTVSETIYPREKFTYLKSHRQRESFENGFWRSTREDRNQTKVNNSQGYSPILGLSQSMWPLDGRFNFTASLPTDTQLFGSGSEGELKNTYCLFHTTGSGAASSLKGNQNNLHPAALYARRICEFSIIGKGDTKWTAADISGLTPFYKDYDAYVDEIKRAGKDYSVIPEFRISEHMDFYINTMKGNFVAQSPPGFLTITGSTPSSSADGPDFFSVYSHTDFLKYFEVVTNDYTDKRKEGSDGHLRPRELTLRCKAMLKLLPYDGFYPVQRTVELASLFSQSYSENATLVNQDGDNITGPPGYFRPLVTPFFAPGILYNTIKSGIAVDYPYIPSGEVDNDACSIMPIGSNNTRWPYEVGPRDPDRGLSRLHGRTEASRNILNKYRVPFEALVDPEAYIGDELIVDLEPHRSASIDCTASIGFGNSPLYKLAMHNFLAESSNLFLKDGKLTTISSKKQNEFKEVTAGKKYKMRIVCSHAKVRQLAALQKYYSTTFNETPKFSYEVNPPTIAMYERTGTWETDPRAIGVGSGLNTFQYWGEFSQSRWGSSFGPPIDCISVPSSDPGSGATTAATFFSSFEPYTPPYYDGYSHIEITYAPTQNGRPDIATIHSELTAAYLRETTIPTLATSSDAGFTGWSTSTDFDVSTAHSGAMQLSSSLNWKMVVQDLDPVYDDEGNVISVGGTDGGGDANKRWIIQPKYECPVLDFSGSTRANGEVVGYDRGMWQQYGEIVTSSPRALTQKGIFLQIQDLSNDEIEDENTTGSLADILGFSKDEFSIGNIETQRTISEAVVAIPFYRNTTNEQKRFYISRRTITMADAFVEGKMASYNQTANAFPNEVPSANVIDMVRKMKKFVLPPKLDFLTNKTLTPFTIYIFPFEVALSQQDLANIWQNLLPEIGTAFQKKDATISHNILASDVFAEDEGRDMLKFMHTKMQWMVFKAKQRAKTNYFELTADSKDDERFKFDFGGDRGKSANEAYVPDYSFNWPYDFFSLIELVKIDSEVKISTDANKTEPSNVSSDAGTPSTDTEGGL